jgi:hypothetical protein
LVSGVAPCEALEPSAPMAAWPANDDEEEAETEEVSAGDDDLDG